MTLVFFQQNHFTTQQCCITLLWQIKRIPLLRQISRAAMSTNVYAGFNENAATVRHLHHSHIVLSACHLQRTHHLCLRQVDLSHSNGGFYSNSPSASYPKQFLSFFKTLHYLCHHTTCSSYCIIAATQVHHIQQVSCPVITFYM